MDTAKVKSAFGVWSLLGITILLFIFSFYTHLNVFAIGRDFLSVFSGNFEVMSLNPLGAITVILQSTLIMVVITLAVLCVTPHGKSFDLEAFKELFEDPKLYYTSVMLEELFGRFFFITILGGWLFHTTGMGLIVLMIFGDIAWSLIHWTNYKNKKDRKILALLPQFIGGLVLGYLYLRYGFWITLLIHLTYNSVLIAILKEELPSKGTFLRTLYWAGLGIMMWFLMNHYGLTLAVLLPWLTSTGSISNLSLSIFSMAIVMTALDCILGLAGNLLTLDPLNKYTSEFGQIPALITILIAILVGIVVILGIMGINWLVVTLAAIFGLSQILTPTAVAIIIGFFLTTFISKPTSGSAIAHNWFFGMPGTFMLVFITLTFGFWAIAVMAINVVLTVVPLVIPD